METNSSDCCIVLTTYPDLAGAEKLAQQLITQNLAACVNILPEMTSVYRWQGQMERGQEHQLLIKTKLAQFEAVEKTIKLVHPYELPEIVVVPIVGGHQPYLNWITESVAKHE